MKRKAIYKDHKVEVLNIDMQNTALIVYQSGETDTVLAYNLKFLPQEQADDITQLSKRELIAAMAMQGMLANSYSNGSTQPLSESLYEQVAEFSVEQADALLTELNKEP